MSHPFLPHPEVFEDTHSTIQSALLPELVCGKTVVAKLDREHSSSESGALLLKAVEEQLALSRRLTACIDDARQPGKIRHEPEELLRRRVFGIACGYADANDAARIADAPMHSQLDLVAAVLRPGNVHACWARSRSCSI